MFSLLNLAVELYLLDDNEKDFHLDYESLDKFIMEKFAWGFVWKNKEVNVLELLYHAGHGKSMSFCSWIPDFMGLRLSERGQRIYPPIISTWKTRRRGGFFSARHGFPSAETKNDRVHRAPVLAIRGCIIDQIAYTGELGLGDHDRITFAKALSNIRHYTSNLGVESNADDHGAGATGESGDGDFNHSRAGERADQKEQLLFWLLIGDSKGPQTGRDWATRFSYLDINSEEDISPWPEQTREDILSLRLDEDAHGYGAKPPEMQERMA
ncbi:hypothetical protein B0I35DRAFT_515497 [Stachybotrys elegans]|uniref:Uncharacterized protein n=1 Tax=Stachybotrys elegans TaxID=80388 RepID=A0A8K0WLT0_9HYPO|nr:hypothetical protein B0I35DRAFT_515497 [Stachybotrys elegans]